MKRTGLILLALTVLALVPQVCMAQRPGGGGGRGFGGGLGAGFGGPLMLLAQESVQKELALTEEQIEKSKALAEKQRELFSGFRDLKREERQAKIEEINKANNAALAEILNADQLKRVKQIGWQQRGVSALSDPEVATALTLTDEQKTKVTEILDASREEMRSAGEGGEGDREKAREAFQKIRKATDEKLVAVLTSDQQGAWKTLLGEEFKGEIRRPEFGRRPGGGEGGGRRRNNDN